MSEPSDIKNIDVYEDTDNWPAHCNTPCNPDCPTVAVPHHIPAGLEHALLVTPNALSEVMFSLVNNSVTLKAWFALQLSHVKQAGQYHGRVFEPQWWRVWELIRVHKSAWIQEYDTQEQSKTQWELHQPSSVGELYALALFVLYRKVQSNPGKDDERVVGLKWHKYYHEDEGRYFLLHDLLGSLDYHCTLCSTRESETQSRCRTEFEKSLAWQKSHAKRMHSAVLQFQIGE
jgi:hypothetical protein